MKTVIGDFHVHTLLSPCAEIEMTPHHIVMQAAEYGIQLLAVTDHNASANAVAAIHYRAGCAGGTLSIVG